MDDFLFYFRIGWEHIISIGALDHQLFIIALAAIYLLRDWKQVLILVTAFTIGHSLTLVLSVLDIIRFDAKWVEILIPCTIIVTGISNFFQLKFRPRALRLNYFFALFFGLIHGMGFASSVRFMLSGTQQLAVGLTGFNTGLEVGQIVVVVVFMLLGALLMRYLHINRRDWVVGLSSAVIALAGQMVIERI